jgi:aminoacrylate peracid reductase
MAMQPIIPPGSPPPLAPYSPGTKAGGFIFVSGTLAIGPDGSTVGAGDVTAQTKYVLETIKSVIEAGGGTMKDVTFNQIFLKDFADYAAMSAVYKEYFPEKPPARYCIQAPLVRAEFLVEIATTAYVGT